jgi:hypothetical protein
MVWRAPSKADREAAGHNRTGFHSNYKNDGNKYHSHANNNEQPGGYTKPSWKNTSRWNDTNEAGNVGKLNKEKEEGNGWRKVGSSGKPEPLNASRSGRSGSHDISADESGPKNLDGWTKVKNPFVKNEN